MSSPFIPPGSFVRFLGANGQILPFGKLYFYASGTLTESTVYDADGDVLAQPVLADITGAWPQVYVSSSVTYRVRIETAAGVEVADVDPFPGSFVDLSELAKTATATEDDLIGATITCPGAFGVYAGHFLHTGSAAIGGGAVGGATDNEGLAYAGVFNRRTNVSGVAGTGAAIQARSWEKNNGSAVQGIHTSSGTGNAGEFWKAAADVGADSAGDAVNARNSAGAGCAINSLTDENHTGPISNLFTRRKIDSGYITREQVLLGGARTGTFFGHEILFQPATAWTGAAAVVGCKVLITSDLTGSASVDGVSVNNQATAGTEAHGGLAIVQGINTTNYGWRANVSGAATNWAFYADNGNFNAQTGAYHVATVKVVGAQGAAVADAVNAAGVPTQAEFNAFVTQFNLLLARVRAHGLIAT